MPTLPTSTGCQLLSTPAGEGPRRYLHERGIAPVLASTTIWKVGYAPAGWTVLIDHLRARGHSDQTLMDAGLAHTCRRGTLIDRFRDRIVVPVHAHTGGVVAFVGRAAPCAPVGCPKYLNTPTTGLYRKSDTVFGLYEQTDLLHTGGTPVIVEGPLDAIAINPGSANDQARLAAVSVCGTALTPMHAASIAAVSRPGVGVVLALDDDQAGGVATKRARTLLAPIEGPVRDASSRLAGQDPAGYVQRYGSRALRSRRPTRAITLSRLRRYGDTS